MLYLKNEFMNWDGFLHADSVAIIFGLTNNPTLSLWLLNVRGPVQLYSFSKQ